MKQFTNILCVVATEDPSISTLERAVSLAENNQAQLTVADVMPDSTASIRLPDPWPVHADLLSAMKAERLQALQSLVEPYQRRCSVQLELLVGTGFLEIIRRVLRNEHDLLIKNAENPSFIERLFGSDDMHLLRKCPCPVWLTQPAEKSNYDCIMAAVDFDPDRSDKAGKSLNQQIIELSVSLALSDFATLHLVHAWDAYGETTIRAWSDNPDAASVSYVEGIRSQHQSEMNKLREHLVAMIGKESYDYLSPRFHMLRGPASTKIPEYAKELQADLVVMGTVGRTGISGLLIGNTADTILEQLRCSVLAIKPPGFTSPVSCSK
jgi:universal stress protein E